MSKGSPFLPYWMPGGIIKQDSIDVREAISKCRKRNMKQAQGLIVSITCLTIEQQTRRIAISSVV